MSNSENSSYGRIAKSSALLGGSAVVDVLFRTLRIKILATQIGPAGYGIMSLYSSFINMMISISSLGMAASAVREVANAAASEDEIRISRTAKVVRRIAWITGLMGLVATVCIAHQASWWTFQNAEHVWAIAVLGLVVLFSQLKTGYIALLSGLRRIRDVAGADVLGSLLGTIAAISMLLLLGESGIVPFLLAIAAGQLAASWWFARRVPLPAVSVSWRECAVESRAMLHLGVVLTMSAIALAVSTYAIRLIIQVYLGEDSVGIYQAAFALSGVYVGFILQAMAGDYFPRLVGVSENREARNRFVNEQAEMAVLFAVPGLIALLLFSDILIWIMYSEKFVSASDVLRWQILGMFGRIVSWPMGFILLAKADKRGVFWSELISAGAHVGLVWIGVRFWGVIGAGMAFTVLYLLYVVSIYWIVKIRHNYDCGPHLVTLTIVGTLLVALAFGATFISDPFGRYGSGGILLAVASVWALYGLVERLGKDRVMALLHRVIRK